MSLLPQVAIDAVLTGSLYALLATGIALSFGVTRILNFAHGEFIMFGAYAAFWPFALAGVDPLLALPVVCLLAFVAGRLLFKVTVAGILDAPHANQILMTFGIALVLQNLAAILWTGDVRSATPPYALESLDLGFAFVPEGRLVGLGVAIIVALLLWSWLRFTDSGRAARAIAQNRGAATLMGVDVVAKYETVFGVSAVLAAATGCIMSFVVTFTPFTGIAWLLKGFAIVILGGIGSLGGTIVGAFVLAAVETAVSYYVPEGSGWAEGVAYALLFAILIVRPNGLFGRPVGA